MKRHLSSGTYTLGLIAAISIAAAVSGASCTDNPPPATTGSSSGSGGGAGGSDTGGGGSGGTGGQGGNVDVKWKDFPQNPVVEDGLVAETPALFDAQPAMPGGPCVSEPPNDAMVPSNWTPLFIEWTAAPEANIFELRAEVDNQENPLVVYTTKTTYTMPSPMWQSLALHSAGEDIRFTIRAGRLENGAFTVAPLSSEQITVHIAPVAAPGSVVYWAYEPVSKATSFKGFTVGDAETKIVLKPETAGPNAAGQPTECISCHSSSADGKVIFYTTDNFPMPSALLRSVDARNVIDGKRPGPDVISDAAFALLGRHRQATPILSQAHYKPGDSIVVTTYAVTLNPIRFEFIWTDLQATDSTGWGVIARNGDTKNPSSPSWRHDGTEIAYVTSADGLDGFIAQTTAADPQMDIYTVPYNNRMGGDAKPLPGASDPAYTEFYPVYSPDDTFISFNRTDKVMSVQSSYDQPAAEMFLVEGKGGTPVRLRANDPPECTGYKSPGLTNSWTRWAPQASLHNEKKYYWMVFSSKRRAAAALRPQLYVSAVVTRFENGKEVLDAEYPGVYVLPQDPLESNHTPSWDYFVVNEIPK